MNGFWWNCALAGAWVLVTGDARLVNAALGFAVATGVLVIVGPAIGAPGHLTRMVRIFSLSWRFLRDLIVANLLVTFDVITPKSRLTPGVIAVPLHARTDAEIALLANLLTLTPGTTSLDISADRSTLYLHVMYLGEGGADAARRSIHDGLERHLLEVTR